MSRTSLASILAVVLALPFAVQGHVPILISSPPSQTTISWPSGTTITYRLHNQIGSLPNLEAGSSLTAAIDAAAATIAAGAGRTVANGGPTAQGNVSQDGVNLVTGAPTASNLAVVGGALAVTYTWWNGLLQITEADVMINPSTQLPLSTQGTATHYDVQSIMTHEDGHGFGLDHSPVYGATMYPYEAPGSIRHRVLSGDDQAGLGALYGMPPGATGTVSGTLLDSGGAAIAGGHVFLEDAITGRVVVGVVSRQAGAFSIPRVPRGLYHVHAEPLDGPFVPANLIGPYWQGLTLNTSFRAGSLGGTASPTTIVVKSGQSTAVGSLQVPSGSATRSVDDVFYNNLPNLFGSVRSYEVTPPYTGWIGVFGVGFDLVPDSYFEISGPFVSITGPSSASGPLTSGSAYKVFPVAVSSEAPPGHYLLRVRDQVTGEVAFFPGVLDVQQATPTQAWSAAYEPACLGSLGPVTLSANNQPYLGVTNYSFTVTGAVPGQTAFLVFAFLPDHLLVWPGCWLGLDPFNLVLPLPGVPVATPTGSVTVPIPVPPAPILAGVEIFTQVVTLDPSAPQGVGISNALVTHFE